MRPAKSLLDIARAGETHARRIVPKLAAQTAVSVEGFIHHVPGVHLAGEVSHYALDMVFQNAGKLLRCEVPGRQPTGILVVPDQGMTADRHVARAGEGHDG